MYNKIDIEYEKLKNPTYIPKSAYEHQIDAFKKLSDFYDFKSHQSGILALPTGAGKTFTSVNWICRNVLSKNIKVVWLAHTSHLLEQAYQEFSQNILEIPHRKTLNIRVVSSNPKHDGVKDIENADDVLIITTQTAISNYKTAGLDLKGEGMITNFEKFLIHSQSTGLFLVLDEAHHAPAYGCRNLLIGGTKFSEGIRQFVPNANFLGLTATPTYSDKHKRGLLLGVDKIFSNIIHEAKKPNLQEKGILAHEKYYEVQTGEVFDLDDKDYEAVVREHKDLPDNVVTKMAESQQRNNLIVEEYVTKKELYGKTIIFADRWFQCVDLKEKLLKRGVKADAIYSHIDASSSDIRERNKRTSTENGEILEQFKKGDLAVLINVKMLTEGTDVPDVDTVFITRQTTSQILLTQMIGRALRGTASQKNGKIKDIANIVFFEDTWRRLINFAQVEGGGIEDDEPKTKGRYPMEWISIHLVEELSHKLDNGRLYSANPYLSLLPLGWYETEISISIDDDLARFKEFIVVNEDAKPKFEKLIDTKLGSNLSEWEDENLSDDFLKSEGTKVMNIFFDDKDNHSGTLDFDVVRMMRHLAQKGEAPKFIYFEERNAHNLAELAHILLSENQFVIHDKLEQEYSSTNRLWSKFYKDFNRFKARFDVEVNKAIQIHRFGKVQELNISAPIITETGREPSEEVKERVRKRDNYTCQCCGYQYDKSIRSRKLEIDHIVAYHFGGDNTENNLQVLCSACNKEKKISSINFTIHKTAMSVPKDLSLLSCINGDTYANVLQRIVNFFYHCNAVCVINTVDNGKIKYRDIWEIELYSDNPTEWLLNHKQSILDFVQNSLNYPKLEDITIK